MKNDNLIDMKNNLIQSFYIIGFPPEDFFQVRNNNKGEFINFFEKDYLHPKIISKFPPSGSNFNGILDEIIIDHSFPFGLKLTKFTEPTIFFFELDNLLFNYSKEEKKVYSKLYFTCLEFYEPLTAYFNFKNEIKKNYNTIKIKDDYDEKIDLNTDEICLPKIICFASILPFFKELSEILVKIYKLYSKNKNNQIIPIEKLIEQIVLSIPIPIMNGKKLKIFFESFGQNITFPLFNGNEKFLLPYYTNIHMLIFQYLSNEEIIKIYKCILLEIPLLFFSDNKYHLSSIIETFLSLISPFRYAHPCISILPKKLYGLINSEKKFLFGINQNYDDNFFDKNDIDLDKNIIIVNLLPNHKSKIEEVLKKSNDDEFLIIQDNLQKQFLHKDENIDGYYVFNNYIQYNDNKYYLINIVNNKLNFETSLEKDITKFLEQLLENKLQNDNLNFIIQNIFYKFLIQLLSGYNDYMLNSKYFCNSKNCVSQIFYGKGKEKLTDFNFVKENFNIEKLIIFL